MLPDNSENQATVVQGALDPSCPPRDAGWNALISIVTPFYNEEETIDQFFRAIELVMVQIPNVRYEVVCVNDGSQDRTLELLAEKAKQDKRIRVIDLSRNFGKEAALTAGIDHALGRAVIPFDADLQDSPHVIPELVERWRHGGAEVVLAARSNRASDSVLKRLTAKTFYKIHNQISDHEIPENVGDFRLMDRKVVDALKALPERRRFMKGLFAWVGFRTETIAYTRAPRVAGKTKFSGWRLWNFALEGITSFSTALLRIWTYVGLAVSAAAMLYGFIIIGLVLLRGRDVPGYASLLVAVLMLGGIQLTGIGVLGEYIGRIYVESKQRPVYVVRQIIEGD